MDVGTLLLLPAWAAFLVVWLVGATRTARTVKRSLGWDRVLFALVAVLAILLFRTTAAPGLLAATVLPRNVVTLALSLVLAYAGVAFAIWARVHLGRYWSGAVTLKEGHELVRTGPYAIVRNPIYTGLIAACLGSEIVLGRAAGLVVVLVVIVTFILKIRAEEKLLRERFGDAFDAYAREVPRLVPGLW